MDYKNVFRRYELKYLLSTEQTNHMRHYLDRYARPDDYSHSSIRNVYYDTEDYLLARRSIEHPLYKEKLRLRSYGRPEENGVYVELKKKYNSVVYKRRITLPLKDAERWFSSDDYHRPDSQIGREIDFMRIRYPDIGPKMYLSYERDSFLSDNDLRITLDDNIYSRTTELTLASDPYGTPILPEGYTLMEIKTLYGYPEWLTEALSKLGLYRTTFSKYGASYKILHLRKTPEEYIPLNIY